MNLNNVKRKIIEAEKREDSSADYIPLESMEDAWEYTQDNSLQGIDPASYIELMESL